MEREGGEEHTTIKRRGRRCRYEAVCRKFVIIVVDDVVVFVVVVVVVAIRIVAIRIVAIVGNIVRWLALEELQRQWRRQWITSIMSRSVHKALRDTRIIRVPP